MTEPPEPEELRALAGVAAELELRADLAGEIEPEDLRRVFGGTLAYSLRSVHAGGAGDTSRAERRRRLIAAAGGHDLVELEHGTDTSPETLAAIPPERRRLSWRGPAASAADLASRFRLMAGIPARHYVLAPAVERAEDALAPLALLARLRRRDVTAYASGEAGAWTRLLAPRLGADLVTGSLRDPAEGGQLGVGRLVGDYGMPVLGPLHDLYAIVGGSVGLSLAPRIYNRGFRSLGLHALCLPISTPAFAGFWRGLVADGLPGLGIPLRGLTVVSPHKEEAMTFASLATERASEAAAANSLVRAGSAWQAANTSGVVAPLEAAGVSPAGRRAAVVGCGGAGRSVAAELRRAGARVTLVNRGEERGRYASRLLGMPWAPLATFAPSEFDLLVNATPLSASAPVDANALAGGAAVVDLVYAVSGGTALLDAARSRGLVAIGGRRVLVAETARQFQLMTGQPLPPDAIEAAFEGSQRARV